jgi:hypothetical protein
MMVLGIIFLTTFFVVDYWYSMNIGILKMQVFEQYIGYWLCFFLVGGAVLLIVGVLRTDIPSIKKYRGLIAFSIPMICTLLFFHAGWVAINQSFSFPTRSEITQVTVVSTSPLILSLNVKAITDYDNRIDGALIMDSNNNRVAEISKVEMAVLPAGSEIALTLDFNTTLPSGDYLVRLYAWEANHGSSPFTIP